MNDQIEMMIARTNAMIQELDQLLLQVEEALAKQNRDEQARP